jgi:hypothetical protein
MSDVQAFIGLDVHKESISVAVKKWIDPLHSRIWPGVPRHGDLHLASASGLTVLPESVP